MTKNNSALTPNTLKLTIQTQKDKDESKMMPHEKPQVYDEEIDR